MGLQLLVPVLRTCKYLWLCELRFRTRPLFLATILGGNHFRDNQVAINPYGKSPLLIAINKLTRLSAEFEFSAPLSRPNVDDSGHTHNLMESLETLQLQSHDPLVYIVSNFFGK